MDVSAHGENDSFDASLRSLSHDLRTPMAVIRLQAQYLLRAIQRCEDLPTSDRDRIAAGLRRIDDSVSTLGSVLDHLDERADLDWTRKRWKRT